MAENAMSTQEALEIAGELLDSEDGGVETLMERGIDVIEALRAALTETEEKLVEADEARESEVKQLRLELAGARAAIRDCARKCEHRCGRIAVIRAGDEIQEGGAFRYCDDPECRRGEPVRGDLPHAEALRAAETR